MGYWPAWRFKFKPGNHKGPWQSDAFKAARKLQQFGPNCPHPQCEKIAKSTGERCQMPAMRGAKLCRQHKGLLAAATAEAERYGRPVIIRRRVRQRALGTLGATAPWPEGLPKYERFMNLGPFQRGRLFEAWENRLTAPDLWQAELDMPRYRMLQKGKVR